MHRKSNAMLSLPFFPPLFNIFAISNCNKVITVFPALTAVAYLQSHMTREHLVMGWAVLVLQCWTSSLQWDNPDGTKGEVLTPERTLS